MQKKKTITDVLAVSEPKAGCPADLQKTVIDYFSDKRSVIEMEELKLKGERGGEGGAASLPSEDKTKPAHNHKLTGSLIELFFIRS